MNWAKVNTGLLCSSGGCFVLSVDHHGQSLQKKERRGQLYAPNLKLFPAPWVHTHTPHGAQSATRLSETGADETSHQRLRQDRTTEPTLCGRTSPAVTDGAVARQTAFAHTTL